MVEVYSDVGGERHCVADEKKRSTIVADARMAWMWKVGVTFLFPITKLKKNPKKQTNKKNIKTVRYRGFLRACPHFSRCEIRLAVMLRGSKSDFSLLACLL